jgi:aryl-alcohol dehydrogenase-like predicted oxidoreductase
MTEPLIALGAMFLGTRLDDAASFALLDAYVDAGGVWIDTADCYAFWVAPAGHGGQSEQVLGRWLAARPGVRERVKIATKVGAEPATPGDFTVQQGLSDAVVRAGLEGSLRRLGTDRVELYWAHVEDLRTPVEETAAAFGDLVDSGRAGAWGVSNHPAWKVERMRFANAVAGRPGPVALQHRFSYLTPRPDHAVEGAANRFGMASPEILDYCAEHGLELWAYTSLLTGAYERADRPFTEEYRHPGTDARLAVLDAVAADTGLTRSQAVLAWLVAHGIRPILGGSTVDQLRQALAGVRAALTAEQVARLDAAG